jgi:hypothetical protein
MTGKKSTVQIALDSWQLFCWHHPWVKDIGKACCIALCYPVFACYRCFHAPIVRCGTSRLVQDQLHASRMFDLQMDKREHQHKRRNSLTGNLSTTWKLGGFLKRRDRWCDQKSSPLFSKLPPELRIKIYALVLNEQNLLRVVPNEAKGKFRIHRSSVYKGAELSSEISHMMFDTFHYSCSYTGQACRSPQTCQSSQACRSSQAGRSRLSLLSLLLSCRRM